MAEGVTGSSRRDPETLAATHQAAGPILRYLARALAEGSPTATALFDEIVALTAAHLANLDDATSDASAGSLDESWLAPQNCVVGSCEIPYESTTQNA